MSNFDEDELERMRARRAKRMAEREAAASAEAQTRSRTQARAARAGHDSADPDAAARSFKSGYSGPKDGAAGRSRSRAKGGAPVRGGKGPGLSNKKKILIIIAEILVIIALLAGSAAWYMYHKIYGSMAKIEFNEEQVKNVELTEEQIEKMSGFMTVACFGVDSRNMGVGKGANSDVNIVANVDLGTGEIKLVSIFRDTYLNVNDKDSYNKINSAYCMGGPEQAVKAINKNLGLNITQYATFNWKAVADAINILGGVDIELSPNELSWINAFITETVEETGVASVHLTQSGLVHMDGVQAVAYGRLRLGDTDYARTERQRIVIQKAFDKAKRADWNTLNCIIQTVVPQCATNIDITDVIPLARNIANFHFGDTLGFPMARAEKDIGKIGDCVVPQTLEANVIVLHQFLFNEENYEVPSNVRDYSNHIASVTGYTSVGNFVGHVRTDQGVSAKAYVSYVNKKQAESAAKAAATEESKEKKETEPETDEDGNVIKKEKQTDADGNPIDPEEDPEEIDDWLEQWNNRFDGPMAPGDLPVGPVKPGDNQTKPGETSSSKPGSEPPAPGPNDGPGGNSTPTFRPSAPGETAPQETSRYDKPGETSSVKPGESSSSKPGESSSSKPGETTGSKPGSSETLAPSKPGDSPSASGPVSPSGQRETSAPSAPGSQTSETIAVSPADSGSKTTEAATKAPETKAPAPVSPVETLPAPGSNSPSNGGPGGN